MSRTELKLVWMNGAALVDSKNLEKKALREARRAQRRGAVVTRGQLKTLWSTVIILFIALAGLFYWNARSNFISIENSIGELKSDTKTAIGDLKTDIGKRIDRLEDRILRLEYPQFSSKAAAADLKPSLSDFERYLAQAESLGIVNPALMPVKLTPGFTIQTEGVLSDKTVYSLTYRLIKLEGDRVHFSIDGHVGTNTIKRGELTFRLEPNKRISVSRAINLGQPIPQIWLTLLERPTKETVILVSGSSVDGSA